MEHETIEQYLPEFLNKYNISSTREVNCNVVSDADLERLGDAVMESNHPGDSHEAMDAMMGGEGSESLRQMYINMGRSYLGCSSGGYQYGYQNSAYSQNQTLTGIALILTSALILVLIRYFWIKGPKAK